MKNIVNIIRNSEKTVNIKLLGDSITHGMGGTGYKESGEYIVFDELHNSDWHRNPDGFCWAKLFKEYMEENYNCTVTNNGCSGVNISFVTKHFDTLVDEKDDIIICTIGTNNRHWFFDWGEKPDKETFTESVYKDILELNEKLKKSGKYYVLVANIPCSQSREADGDIFWHIIDMPDINALYYKAQKECGFSFLSLYDKFSDYCKENSVTVDSLLADGLHPNDEGYKVMFNLIMNEMGVEDDK